MSLTEPQWIDAPIALAVHQRQLSEHGGPEGVRDEKLLESALAKPLNQWTYGDKNYASLAAAYAFGIARNHPFVDGNKRTAWVIARLFLLVNEQSLNYEKDEAIHMMQSLAAGDYSEEDLCDWFHNHLEKIGP